MVLVGLLVAFACRAQAFGAGQPGARRAGHPAAWRFVSIPDFLNADVAYPEPNWDQAVDYVLGAIKAEDPDFVVVPGDLVLGRWSRSQEDVAKKAAVYYPAWVKRMQDHSLKFYAALGDHELGDNPWRGKKRELVPHYEEAFRKHLRMPRNGPEHMQGLAYSVRHKNLLMLVLDVFEQDAHGDVHMDVAAEQLAWVQRTLRGAAGIGHIVVAGHVPILPERPGQQPGRELSLERGAESDIWRVLAEHAVDLYLCGHRHTTRICRKDDVHQIIHGSAPAKQSSFSYLLVTVFPDRLELEVKRIGTVLAGDKGGAYKYANRIVRITEKARARGFRSVGRMTIRKHVGGKSFEYHDGVFRDRFDNLDGAR